MIFFAPTTAYIDPGTGSLLFALFLGVFGAVQYFFRSSFIKLKFMITGGKASDSSADKLPIVIFSDDKRYWNVFGPICDELERRHIKAEYWTMSEDDPAFEQNYKTVIPRFIGKGNKGFAKLNVMNAKICLSTTPGLDVYQWKRSKNVDKYVHIYHEVTEGMRYRMFGLDYYDVIFLNASFQERYIRILEEKRNIHRKECIVCGSVYLDEMIKQVQSKSSSDKSDKEDITVLMAPSWGPNSLLSRFGAKLIDSLLTTGFKIIIRPHPQTFLSEKDIIDPLLEKYPNNDLIVWDRSNSNVKSLMMADILISDFSGIVIDYACVYDGPVIVADTEFDASIYDAAWIDEPLWMDQIIDRIGIKLDENAFGTIKDTILELVSSNDYTENRRKLRDEIWENQGKATSTVVDNLTELLE